MKTILCSTVLLFVLIGDAAFCDDIHDAAMKGDWETVRSLIVNDPHLINSRDSKQRTPLHIAAAFGHRDVAELLLINGAAVNQTDGWTGQTPLHFAELYGREDVVELLHKFNANDKAVNCNGLTPIDMRNLHIKYDGSQSPLISTANVANEYYSAYTEDFKLTYAINRIGNVGELRSVVDLRGFIPLMGQMPDTKSEFLEDRDLIYFNGSSGVSFYEFLHNRFIKVPTKIAVGVIYYGQGAFDSMPGQRGYIWPYQVSMTPMSKMDNVTILQEKGPQR